MRAVSPVIAHVTERVRTRSIGERAAYLLQIRAAQSSQPYRQRHVCSHRAHACAAAPEVVCRLCAMG